jgi:excisionase family DNA binding protein
LRQNRGVKRNCNSKPASGQSDVFNEAEAAAYLKITKRTCRDWRARRGLPACKPTAKITLYRKADLDEWLLRSRVALPPRSTARRIAPAAPPPRSKCQAVAAPRPAPQPKGQVQP